MLATSASAGWEPLPGSNPVSISSLQDGGSLVFGDKEISEFEMFGFSDGGALDPNPDEMFVQGGKNSVTGDYGLKFTFSWSAVSGQTINATLSFKVSILHDYGDALIKDIWLDLTGGAGATGAGVVDVTENVRNAGGDVIASLSCSKQYGDGDAYLVDYADEFAPVREIWIYSKDVSITGGADGSADLSEFYQYYSRIPEPATLVLLGTAGIWIFTRRKQSTR
jgi:hypothetical protein